MSEYVLPENEANSIEHDYNIAKDIDNMLRDNNLFEQHKEQNSKVTIIIKKQHIPVIDEIIGGHQRRFL